ncbi:hypothetical protein JB92DRAFT_429976 [Gautieria morchelliformis]|nr:hypothetical protein JB92DRAFT_429976 [Gautieria morchelliformis]
MRRFRRPKQPNNRPAYHDDSMPPADSSLPAAVMETLRALRDSSDAFPPLKSVTGGLLHLIELSETVKGNREGCHALAMRAREILLVLDDVVPNPTKIPPEVLDRISDFTRSLEPIEEYMKSLQRRKWLNRVIHHRKDQDKITELKQNLDRAFQEFQMTSSIVLQNKVIKLAEDITALGTRLHSLDTSAEHAKTINRQMQLMLTRQMQLLMIVFF